MFCLLINLISMSNEFIGSTESILDNGNAEGKEGGGGGGLGWVGVDRSYSDVDV